MQSAVRELHRYLRATWRRRWLGMAVSWVIAMAGAFTVFTMPDRYEATARIYVDTDSLLGPLLRGLAIESDPRKQIQVMQDTLLSKPNLRKVARATDMDLHANTPEQLEEIVARIADNATLKSEGSGLFRVSYTSSNPELAQKVVQALLTIFIESNLGQNRSEMESAQSFIEQQIALYEQKLSEAEHKLAKFRAKNADVLGPSNYSQRIQSMREQIEQAAYAHDDAVGKRDQLRAKLAQTPRLVTMETAPQIVIGGQGAMTTLERIRMVQAQLDDLLLRYTESHPDVVAARRQLDRLIKQFNREQSGESINGLPGNLANTSKLPNPIYEEIQIRLLDAEAEVDQTERRLAQLEKEYDRLQQYAAIAPAVDAEMADLTRDYEVIKRNYEELLSRREAARISQAVDADAESTVKFRIIEPPEVPLKPSAPNRPLFLGMVLLVAIGGGAGAAFARTQIEETYYDPEQLERTFQMPVLGTVTQVLSVQEGAKKAAKTLGFLVATGCFFAFFAALYVALILFYSADSPAANPAISSLM